MILLYTILYLWCFWALYVLVMGLYRAHLNHKLSKFIYFLAAPFLLLGLIVDFLANITLASIVFLDIPREWLVTARLKKYVPKDNWRGKLARYICDNLLDIFDPTGNHC